MSDTPRCELCGEPMPEGEEMFKFHGFSGPCPKPPLPRPAKPTYEQLEQRLEERESKMHARIRATYDKAVADSWRAKLAEAEQRVARLEEALRYWMPDESDLTDDVRREVRQQWERHTALLAEGGR